MFNQGHRQPAVKNIIENGVRETNHVDVMGFYNTKMEDVLENGVKKTQGTPGWTHDPKISKVIDKGEIVSGTFVGGSRQKENVDVVINYGVKETYDVDWLVPSMVIDDVVENGIIKTEPANYEGKLVVKDRYIQKIIDTGTKNPTD